MGFLLWVFILAVNNDGMAKLTTVVFFCSLYLAGCIDSPETRIHTVAPKLKVDGVALGGYSGLHFLREDNNGLVFLTHTDRGPNGDPEDHTGDGVKDRPFPNPGFAPRLVTIRVTPKGAYEVESKPLKRGKKNMSGLSFSKHPVTAGFTGETPVDGKGKPLNADPWGVDPEGIVQVGGKLWMVEEYGPSILRFDLEGELEARYIPKGAGKAGMGGKELLPAHLRKRRRNRGFEAVAFDGRMLYAFVQSPYEKGSRVIRVIGFSPTEEKVVREYIYLLNSAKAEKIGGAVALGPGRIAVVEQNSKTGKKAFRRLFLADFNGASDVTGREDAYTSLPMDVVPAHKSELADLVKMGMKKASKVEGLARVGPRTLAVINDNDFGLQGERAEETRILLIDFPKLPMPAAE